MHSQAQQTDICQTCIHAADCVHHQHCQSQGKAIFHCDEFDDRPAFHVVQGENPGNAEHRPAPTENSIVYIKGRMKGLCVNCGKRESCKYPASEGGVWHCEEYC